VITQDGAGRARRVRRGDAGHVLTSTRSYALGGVLSCIITDGANGREPGALDIGATCSGQSSWIRGTRAYRQAVQEPP
jgi:hypothetical protein